MATCVGRAGGDDLAAEAAGAGAEVEQVVGAGDHFAVVLDDQQRVAQVAELLQGVEQPAVVARVQADRRLVEHVEHAAQAAADLAGQADALRFAAGERRGRRGRASGSSSPTSTRNCSRLSNLADQLAGDFLLVRASSFHFLTCVEQLAQRRAAELVERAVAEPHGRGVVAQPAAAAHGALDLADEVFEQRRGSAAKACDASSSAG